LLLQSGDRNGFQPAQFDRWLGARRQPFAQFQPDVPGALRLQKRKVPQVLAPARWNVSRAGVSGKGIFESSRQIANATTGFSGPAVMMAPGRPIFEMNRKPLAGTPMKTTSTGTCE
jgi:hypothetical protein